MSRLSLVWMGVSCTALAACSSVGSGGMAGAAAAPPATRVAALALCGGGPIKDVKIKSIAPSGSDVTLKMPATVQIGPRKAGVRWTIETAGYIFAPSGIAFKADQPGGLVSAQSPSPTEYVWCFDTTKDLTWSYGIYLTTASTSSPTWYCDPTIVNFGSKLDDLEAAAVFVCRRV